MVLCHIRKQAHNNDDTAISNKLQCENIDPCKYANVVGCDHLKTKRARKFRCRNKRIRQLAQPKIVTQKYCEEEIKRGKMEVEVIRTFEEQTPVRIKLLSYPKVRKLVSSREAYKEIVNKEWYGRFEDLIRRSLLTMYSRLGNVKLPDKTCRKKWTKAEWKRHCEWLKSRARPKMVLQAPKPKRKKVPLEALVTSVYLLSRPRYPRKKYHAFCGYFSPVKEAALTYEPSERILKLASAKNPMDIDEDERDPFQVNPRALKFQPSKFIQL